MLCLYRTRYHWDLLSLCTLLLGDKPFGEDHRERERPSLALALTISLGRLFTYQCPLVRKAASSRINLPYCY